ncbi:uncharacterized protein C5orf34-like [Littorina saxatilis]|uniref:uncharacterized protein C5orf34-like n=1 Tax=Littorina saxatilis TaxID=31220 RepID=UPI0038B43987
MPVVPSLMVLFSNDAVEVRYSDGSRLQLSPCGASIFHLDSPSDYHYQAHPLAGTQGVQKWTQFVTSAHRSKVMQALDFRNRFAQRPFLCSTLIPPEDIVSLYAKIDKVAWPKTPKETNIEVFEDGSRRAVSSDEYASLVLTPHGQDFTVCYLSRISEDVRGGRGQNHSEQLTNHDSSPDGFSLVRDVGSAESGGQHFAGNPKDMAQEKDERSIDGAMRGCPGPKECLAVANSNRNNNDNSFSVARGDGCVLVSPDSMGESTLDASGLVVSDGTVSTPGQHGDLQTSAVSLMHHDISSISRVSTPDGLRGMVDCDETLPLGQQTAERPVSLATQFTHSSPLSLVNAQSDTYKRCTGTVKDGHNSDEKKGCIIACSSPDLRSSTPRANKTLKANLEGEQGPDGNNLNNSGETNSAHVELRTTQEKETMHSASADRSCQILPDIKDTTDNSNCVNKGVSGCRKSTIHQDCMEHTGTDAAGLCGQDCESKAGHRRGRVVMGGGGRGARDSWSASRQHYTWVTQHISCSDCPRPWRHPLRMLQQVDPTDSVLISECNMTVSSNVAKGLHTSSAADPDKCVFGSQPAPLPLTCPFQHLHAWQPHRHDDDHEDQGQELSEFKQGQFKVIMMEGIVYRFVQVANMKVVEVYPGDGSVFVSQGLTGHFFSHILWKDGKLEEKTYSVRMLPPNTSKSPYSVEKLVKRGHRLLTGCIQSSRLLERAELPCWKQAPLQVVEPLSSSVLEECSAPGYGRFTAYSNGRIRILFDDRTALDMVSDFSERLKGCLKHSDHSQHHSAEQLASVKVTSFDQQLSSHRCRLLLPTGKYIIVDIHSPGVYTRYIEAAKEWIKWVQSSPKERREFYQHKENHQNAYRSAEAELKKIECFNYIIDHTGVSNANTGQGSPHSAELHPAKVGIVPNLQPSSSHVTFPIHPPQSRQYNTGFPTAPRAFHSSVAAVGMIPAGQAQGRQLPLVLGPRGVELAQGFNCVREALLRTSQMINDIDQMVNEHKKTT